MSTADLISFEIEPEPGGPVQDTAATLASELEPAAVEVTPPVAAPLMEVLSADIPLPTLIKFVPDVALREVAASAARYALSIDVTGPEGLARADSALTAVRSSQKAIKEHFAEPKGIANQLHKRISGIESEWLVDGDAATKTVGERVWREARRLEDIAAEERRKAQVESDRAAREQAKREADAAAQAHAPATVIEDLRRQAETTSAPPVPMPTPAPVMRGTSTVTSWKARPEGTTGDQEPNPDIDQMTPAQWASVVTLLKAIIDGTAPKQAIAVNYSYLNARAKADKSTFVVPGFEAFEVGGVRAKGTRSVR